jgi:hypothetical protein
MARSALLVTSAEVERFNEVCTEHALPQSMALEMSLALDEARSMVEHLELVKQGRAVPYLAACEHTNMCERHHGGLLACTAGQLRFTLTDAGRDAIAGKVSSLILAELATAVQS